MTAKRLTTGLADVAVVGAAAAGVTFDCSRWPDLTGDGPAAEAPITA